MAEAIILMLTILRTVAWVPGHQHEKAEQFLFQSEAELAKVWKADGENLAQKPAADMSAVDFKKEMVLAAFKGQCNTGGHSITIEKVIYAAGDQELAVIYRQRSPDKDDMVTQALTYPSHVVVVEKKEVQKVTWLEADSKAGKAALEAVGKAK